MIIKCFSSFISGLCQVFLSVVQSGKTETSVMKLNTRRFIRLISRWLVKTNSSEHFSLLSYFSDVFIPYSD